jgi:hypothetical protein
MYGDPTTDYWDSPLEGASRDPEKVYYDYYPKKKEKEKKKTSMIWLCIRNSDLFFYGIPILFVIFTCVIGFSLAVMIEPIMNSAAGFVLSSVTTLSIIFLLWVLYLTIGAIKEWYKKRPAKKKWEREYRMEMLIKSIDNALERYEKLCPKPIENGPYEYTFLPTGVPVPRRTGGGVPRF